MRLIENDDWMITDDDEGGVHLTFVQTLVPPEEEAAIRKKHGEDVNPQDHWKPKNVTFHMCDEDVEELAGILAAWKSLSE